MTTRRLPILPLAGFGLLAAGVYATAATIVHSALFAQAPELGAAAVTFDLVVAVPFFFWLLVVRRQRLPWISIVPCFLLSLLAASFVLPQEGERYLHTARMLVAPAELALAGYAGARVYRAFRRGSAAGGYDVLAQTRAVTREVIPVRAVADAVAGEMVLAWYALLAWSARPEVAPGETAFTAHRKSGLGGMAGAVAFASAGEAVGVHLLVARWSPAAAWALTALSAYGVVWMIGLARSVALRPTVVSAEGVRVRVGVLWEMAIPFDRIASVSTGAATPKRAPGLLRAALLAQPRMTIELAEPMEAVGLYGRRKRGIERLALYVDEPNALAAELRARMAIPTA